MKLSQMNLRSIWTALALKTYDDQIVHRHWAYYLTKENLHKNETMDMCGFIHGAYIKIDEPGEIRENTLVLDNGQSNVFWKNRSHL